MVVLIDTNILLDVLLARQPYCEEALRVLKLAENGEIKGWIAANSVDNIYYRNSACDNFSPLSRNAR